MSGRAWEETKAHPVAYWLTSDCAAALARVAELERQLAEAQERIDRLLEDRKAYLLVATTDGLTASEWILRTGKAIAALAAERAALMDALHDHARTWDKLRPCRHGWRGSAAEAISTPCPSCGLKSLFVGGGGGLTCASLRCKSPSVEAAWRAARVKAEAESTKARLAEHLAAHKTADAHDCAEMEEECDRLRAEVARLEGLIAGSVDEAQGMMLGHENRAFHALTPAFAAEARRIRKREGR